MEYRELSAAAQAAFDRYKKDRGKKAAADRRTRKLDESIKADRELILGELDGCTFGKLPDGRNIVVETTEQKRSAQPAKTVSWQTLVEV
jgi:hypothetical protein